MRNFRFRLPWKEQSNLQFRAEFFNFTNTSAVREPGYEHTTGTAGRI